VGHGEHVAFFSDTTHGNLDPSCELRDVKTGRLLAKWRGGKIASPPDWAKPFANEFQDAEEQKPH